MAEHDSGLRILVRVLIGLLLVAVAVPVLYYLFICAVWMSLDYQ
ncbi:hypothetical protein [Kitasatospora camelliae]|uniref:Carbohydrate ABC transporter permease n=1 Tax=Kitasatospora camelliae TaxID=3156397 RepID=A0AAU8K7M0_9ACTN